MKRILKVLLALAAMLGAGGAAAQITCTVIERLPMTITASGPYCVESDLDASNGGLTIAASDVTIDLGGHAIRGAGNKTAMSYCVVAFGRARITLRNGEVTGCGYGVYLSDFADSVLSQGRSFPGGWHRLERLRVHDCSFRGIRVEGNGNIVRNVDLRAIGGDRFYASSSAIGIESIGPGAKIVGNTLHEVRGSPTDMASGLGISLSRFSSGSLVQDNQVSASALEQVAPYATWPGDSRTTLGIWVGDGTQGAVIEGNSLSNLQTGIATSGGARALLTRNTTSGTPTPFRLPMVAADVPSFGPGNVCDQDTCLFTFTP